VRAALAGRAEPCGAETFCHRATYLKQARAYMGGILSYPETQSRDSAVVDFLVGAVETDVVFDLVFELLACFLEFL
jgi:hypothetical protein